MKEELNTVIKAEDVGKKYIITHRSKENYATLRDTMTFGAKNLVKKVVRKQSNKVELEEFWALKNVSFDIKRGDRVGIIGRNGAGKSTLLKILSRITEPTSGKVSLHGRVASLLEVGTGFHPELTGRENIYLNGAILGMTRGEIDQKFGEIVAFAEIDKFLDTPVKRYSSGMYVRLAFAVAAHLEPEILIVDEVLAVGDAQFQKKCLGKMEEVGNGGRTVIFVSHNMAAIQRLCRTCIHLEKGKIVNFGPAAGVIEKYLESDSNLVENSIDLTPPSLRRNSLEDSKFKFNRITITNGLGEPKSNLSLAEPFRIKLEGKLTNPAEEFMIGYSVASPLGYVLLNSKKSSSELGINKTGDYIIEIEFNENYLSPGAYTISLGSNGPGIIDWIPEAMSFHIEQIIPANSKISLEDLHGITVYPASWKARKK